MNQDFIDHLDAGGKYVTNAACDLATRFKARLLAARNVVPMVKEDTRAEVVSRPGTGGPDTVEVRVLKKFDYWFLTISSTRLKETEQEILGGKTSILEKVDKLADEVIALIPSDGRAVYRLNGEKAWIHKEANMVSVQLWADLAWDGSKEVPESDCVSATGLPPALGHLKGTL